MIKSFIIGYVGKVDNKGKVATFSVASNESVKRGDEFVDKTLWKYPVAFGKFIDSVDRLYPGDLVCAEVKERPNEYQNKDGETIESTQLVLTGLTVLKRSKNNAPAGKGKSVADDLPF